MTSYPLHQLDVAQKGQVFTPPEIVQRMLALRKNSGRVLEPSCGDGAFLAHLPADTVALEIDAGIAPPQALAIDFFTYPDYEKFETIIGNPPYVRARDVMSETQPQLSSQLLNGHANLYLYFIEKCVRHLAPGGELIFITPRDFLKSTGARQLNTWLYEQGTMTHVIELGDTRVFKDAAPNCIIWRFERGNLSHRTVDGRRMVLSGGQLFFTRGIYSVPLSSVFNVKVGAVSGADEIFTNETLGNADFVCSRTAQTGELRRMIFDTPLPYLEQFKDRLIARRVARFDEHNWWKWGRLHYQSDAPRIYVNQKTRNPQPFFTHECTHYDGAILALFPHKPDASLPALTEALNTVDWAELGFVCDGRFIFAQRSLEQSLLPEEFSTFAPRGLL